MARPTDWRPLADHDPVPGNVQTIRDESSRMKDIGVTIRDQVTKLRAIGKDSELKGKYANELRTAASDLAGKLEKTAGRYEKVAGHLNSWASHLEHAQGVSITALNMAPSQNAMHQANNPTMSKPADEMSKEEKAAKKAHEDAAEKTNAQLEQAKSKLREATNYRDDKEGEIAGKIKGAIDDDVEDSWWDNVKDFVDKYADAIKIFIDVVSWIATAVAIVAMFIPGLNVAVFLLVAGLIVVAGRSLLAATGNASWMEVAVDTFGLLTMGAGRAGLAALKGANATAKIAAKPAAKLAARQATSAARQKLGKTLASKTASKASKKAALKQINALKAASRKNAAKALQETPVTGKMSKALNLGDTEGASLINNVKRLGNQFPGSVSPGTISQASWGYGVSQAANWGGFAVDIGDKALGGSDAVEGALGSDWKTEGYSDWKQSTWQAPIGSTW